MNSDTPVHQLSRVIPPPTSISPAAREALATLAGSPPPSYPPAEDQSAWRAQIDAREARWEGWNEKTLAVSPARVDTEMMGGVKVYVAEPSAPDPKLAGRVYLYIHGGAFVFGAGRFAMAYAAMTAAQLGLRTIAIDYRMPPADPYPAPLEDCAAVYRALISVLDPCRVAIGGGSSGANLAAGTVLAARDQGLPLPGAVALLTPVLDLTSSGDTLRTNADIDVVLKRPIEECLALYAGDHERSAPYLSPLNADFSHGFPPTFIQSGTRDLFLSDAVRMHRRLRAAGIDADLNVWEAMPHGGFGFDPVIIENNEVTVALSTFLFNRMAIGGDAS